mgnify:CR=1 FL=1
MRRIILTLAPALLALAAGCNAYRLEPPAGFAQVYADDYSAHMKANNNVGLKVQVFDNVEGGTLTFWSRDMVEKLGKRGYTLLDQKAVESKNGVVGTRFGVGIDRSIVVASLRALICAARRMIL